MAPGIKPSHTLRDGRIDMLKGFGILCVVVAHVVMYEKILDAFWVKAIYVFHMPLFFFLSGHLSVVRQNYRDFFIEKFGQLLVPYVVYFVGILLINKLVGRDDCDLRCLVLGGGYAYNYLGVTWFIPVLFMTQQIGNLLLSRFSSATNLCIVGAMLSVSYLNGQFFGSFKFPYDANVVVATVPFYICGFLIRPKIGQIAKRATIAGASAMTLIIAGYPNYYDIKGAFYGIPFVTFGSALVIVIALIYVFSKLPLWGLLADVGKASLVIMYLHQGIQIFILDHFTDSTPLRVFAAVSVPVMVYHLSLRRYFTRALLLGSKRDLAGLRGSLMSRLR